MFPNVPGDTGSKPLASGVGHYNSVKGSTYIYKIAVAASLTVKLPLLKSLVPG